MGLKQTGAAPACHNSQGPTLPACEKRDLNPRNPFSWVRRLFPFSHSHFSPKTAQSTTIYTTYVITTVPQVHTYTYFILESIRYLIFLLSIIHHHIVFLKFFHPPCSNIRVQVLYTLHTLNPRSLKNTLHRHTRHSSETPITHSSVTLNLFKPFT